MEYICDTLSKNKKRIREFGIFFLIGVLIHLYVLTNKFFNYFEASNILGSMSLGQTDTLSFGRWFLPIATNMVTSFSVPAVNGFLFLTYISLSCMMIVQLLKMESPVSRYLFAALWMSFPGMASAFSFGVNVDAMGLSILLATASVWFTWKFKYGIWLGILLLACSIGIYQPYMAVAIGAAYLILIRQVQKDDFELKTFLVSAGKLLLLLAAGFALYYGILQIFLQVQSVELSNYHGVDNMTSFTPRGIAKGFVYTYLYFLQYGLSMDYTYSIWNSVFHALCLIVLGGMVGQMLIKLWRGKCRVQAAAGAVMWCFLPLGVNAAPFLMADRVGSGVDRYMVFSVVLFWAVFLKMLELVKKRMVAVTVFVAMTGVVISGYAVCNQAYHRLESITWATEGLLNRVAARIEEEVTWNGDIPLHVITDGNLFNEHYQVELPKYDEMQNIEGTELIPSYSERSVINYMRTYLRLPVSFIGDEQKEILNQNEEVKQMPVYPEEGCIREIDGVVVVKFSQEGR